MVRLKVFGEGGEIMPLVVFQFHYGTIKRMRCGLVYCTPQNFNSTMVRLKECEKDIINP